MITEMNIVANLSLFNIHSLRMNRHVFKQIASPFIYKKFCRFCDGSNTWPRSIQLLTVDTESLKLRKLDHVAYVMANMYSNSSVTIRNCPDGSL